MVSLDGSVTHSSNIGLGIDEKAGKVETRKRGRGSSSKGAGRQLKRGIFYLPVADSRAGHRIVERSST